MKRINIFVLLCILILTLTSGAAWAAVASYNNKSYSTLQEAINDAQTHTTAKITLINDITLTDTLTISDDYDNALTIDLDGYDISCGSSAIRALWIHAGNVTITGSGTIYAKGTSDSSSVIRVGAAASTSADFASLIIDEDVIVSSDNCYGIAVFGNNLPASETDTADYYGQYLEINGTVAVTGGASAISGNGTSTLSANRITINENAEISAKSDTGIYHPQSGDIVFYGGTISGPTALELKGGNAIVYGGDFAPTGNTADNSENNNGSSSTGYAIAAIINNNYKGSANVTIHDGTFRGLVDIAEDSEESDAEYTPTVIIAGGTFTNSSYLNEDYLPAGYVAVEDTNSYYTVYRDTTITSLPTASAIREGLSLDNSVLSGGTVKAVTDLDDTTSVDVSGTWTWITPAVKPKVSDDNKTKYGVIFTPDNSEENAKIVSAEITIRVNPASSDTSTGYVKAVSVDSTGELKYDVQGSVPLSTILNNPNVNLADIKKISINSQVSSITNSDLLKVNLDTLDLSSASGLSSGSTLNLSGVTIGTLTMSSGTKVGTLTLSSTSKVSHINAGGAPLTTVNLARNTTIETLNLEGTGVGTLNASGCTNLKTLNASACSNLETLDVSGCTSLETLNSSYSELTSINLEDCDSLETLDVSNNALLFLDISELDSLTTGSWSGQENYKSFKSYKPSDNQINLASFILAYVSSATSADIAARITSVKEFDSSDKEVQQAEYDSSTGIATFGTTPTGYLVYYVNVDDVTASDSEANLAANETSMDVTLYNNEASGSSSEPSVLGPSNAGCNSLGIRSVLLFLAMFIFACAKTKRL